MQRNQQVRFGGGRLETQVKLCAGRLPYFLLFAPDKAHLHTWRQAVIEFLAGLRQKLHEEQAAVFPVETGIPFLGWRVYPDHFRLRQHNGIHFQRRFARQRILYLQGRLSYPALQSSIQGWIAHVSFGDTWGLRRALLSSVVL